MTDIVFLEPHEAALRKLLKSEQGHEASAYILFGISDISKDPWTHETRRRLVSHKIIPVPAEDKISASGVHVTWSTRSFVRLLKEAEEKQLILGIVHTHPGSNAFFSDQDDQNEKMLQQIVTNRAGKGYGFASIVLGGDGSMCARLWADFNQVPDSLRVMVAGKSLVFHHLSEISISDMLERQARLFGTSFNATIRHLRIGIIGCGGTGSPTAMLLNRLGIGRLLLVDDDTIELTNLNRVHGSRRSDAEQSLAKVDAIAREIEISGTGVEVATFKGWVGEPHVRDSLKSCDVLFGCTDDHDGRLFLNRFAYFYGIPVIDMGVRIAPATKDHPYEMANRVTTVIPEHACLLCRGLVNPLKARDEALKRTDPDEYDRRKAEAYVTGGGDPAPAVVTFTTETACMAVNELLQGLTAFRGIGGMKSERQRRFETATERSNTCLPRSECELCAQENYWGKADVTPFLYRVG